MPGRWKRRRTLTLFLAVALFLSATGCHTLETGALQPAAVPAHTVTHPDESVPPETGALQPAAVPVPNELARVHQPSYIIDVPDILLIDALRVIPRPPYHVQPLDSLLIQATNVLPAEPIAGQYGVETDGTVTLGAVYGSVRVAGLTIEEARRAIEKQLKDAGFANTEVRVAMGQSRGLQQIRGEHLVRPDGTVGLGTYGSVLVAGLTLDQARAAIEAHLSRWLLEPEVSVDVFAYNSKAYYIVTDGGGFGEQVYRFPSTGNETVLDAMSQIYGLPAVASKKRIWVARPTPGELHSCQTLPVDWKAITRCGAAQTNYQLLPGDRIYVAADPLVTLDTKLARLFSPIERVLGITLLGSSTVHSVGTPIGGTSNTGGGGGF
jgi:polysaccharide export outer membrane protein